MSSRLRLLVLGCGAIGSRLPAHLPADVDLLCVDRERVASENVGVGAFTSADVLAMKATVVAAGYRARGGVARALVGDVRYAVRPGLVRAVDLVVVSLDNKSAILDACVAVWAARPDLPVLILGCGADLGYQVRVSVTPAACPACTWSEAERFEEAPGETASCADTSAPRAAARAAEAAAAAASQVIAALAAGDRRMVGRRLQSDGGREFVLNLPPAPSSGCPVPHLPGDRRCEPLGGSIDTVTVGTLATRALLTAGADAEILLGRRALPLGGLYCPRCRRTGPAPLRLLPAAAAGFAPCGCGSARPLGVRTSTPAAELLAAPAAALTLAAFGAGHGDVFVVAGGKGSATLEASFTWSDLDRTEGHDVLG